MEQISPGFEGLRSPDGRFEVVQSQLSMTSQLEHIQQLSFPHLSAEELMRAEHYKSHIEVFPEGQHAIIDRSTNQVVACSTDFLTDIDFSHYQHRYIDAVAGNHLSNHNPKGKWLYGADIGVMPGYRGLKLSSMLYRVRHKLIRALHLEGHVVGAMPKGYGAHIRELSIEQYLLKTVQGHHFDPVISILIKKGYAPYGIIPDYLSDESCGNYGVLMLWRPD
ncbi:MAG: nitrilase [Deinococcaceae bacterium]